MLSDSDSFAGFIGREAKKEEMADEKFFTLWYVKQKHGIDGHYTDGKDGGIDYIVEKDGRLIIIQTKLGNMSADESDRFLKAIEAFESKEEREFKRWLDVDVQSKSDKDTFLSLYQKYKGKDKSYEVVVFRTKADGFEKRFKNNRNKNKISIADREDIIYLYNLYLIGVREAPTLTLITDRTSLDFEDLSMDYNTKVFVVKLKPLLQFLNENPESELVFGRNVRVHQGSTAVNDEMKKTWEQDPALFFYGNNGVHIICNECTGGAGEQKLVNPQIINGSQTLHTLKSCGSDNDGWILARVTVIPQEEQTNHKAQKVIDKIIMYSNRNNTMDSMDLRSNDEIQVKLARELFSRRIFYERKTNEWTSVKTKHQEIIHSISSRDLGILMMICDNTYGPVHYKSIGHAPIFRDPDEDDPTYGYYPEMFKEAYKSLDQTETKIRLYNFLKKSLRWVKATKKESKRVPSSSLNYVTSIFWEAIDGYSFRYPIRIPIDIKLSDKLKKSCMDFGREIVTHFDRYTSKNKMSVNDYFRNKEVFDDVRKLFRSGGYSQKLKEAMDDIMKNKDFISDEENEDRIEGYRGRDSPEEQIDKVRILKDAGVIR